MAFARFRQRGHHVPPPVRIILYGLEAAQELTTTIRDLRRTVRLMQSGIITLFPDEASGLYRLYSTLDRDLMQVERSCQFITLQLLTALAETPEDIVQLAAFSCPASRGAWINQLYLVPTGRGLLTDESGRHPVPLDAHPFRVVVRTVHITASLGGFIDAMALGVSLSALVDIVFTLLRMNRPPGLRTWTEAAEGTNTVVRPVSHDSLLRDVVRAIQPLVRIQVVIQDPPNAAVSDSTSELLSPSVVLL